MPQEGTSLSQTEGLHKEFVMSVLIRGCCLVVIVKTAFQGHRRPGEKGFDRSDTALIFGTMLRGCVRKLLRLICALGTDSGLR